MTSSETNKSALQQVKSQLSEQAKEGDKEDDEQPGSRPPRLVYCEFCQDTVNANSHHACAGPTKPSEVQPEVKQTVL
jgi:hypothetical protein